MDFTRLDVENSKERKYLEKQISNRFFKGLQSCFDIHYKLDGSIRRETSMVMMK